MVEKQPEQKLTAILTGASGGIGSAIADLFESSGIHVIGLDRVPSGSREVLNLELSDTDLIAKIRNFSSVDGLFCVVHAAAEQLLVPLNQLSREDWISSFWTNVGVLNHLVTGFQDELLANNGSAVAIGSLHGHLTRKSIGAYAVTKAAIDGWVRSAAIDFAPIRINAVVPGAIDSGKFHEFLNHEMTAGLNLRETVSRRTPLGRLGTPGEIAQAVLFLVGDSSSFITGESLVVDGGASRLLGTEVSS